MTYKIDLTGRTFGRLAVIESAGQASNRRALWRCKCSCGNQTVVRGEHLRSGATTSCGCWHREQLAERSRTHGQKETQLYRVWVWMIQRCTNPSNKTYEYYGGRGITVCPEWRGSFEAFARDMGPTYVKGLTIERINNNGPYEPSNCRWATRQDQARNKRNNRLIEFCGQTKTLAEWAELLGLKRQKIQLRLDRSGWSVERALTTGADPQAVAALSRTDH